MTKSHLLALMALPLILTGCLKSSEYTTPQTYSNPEYGFKFEYPSDWEIRQNPESQGMPLVISKSAEGGTKDYFVVWLGELAETPASSVVKSETEVMIDGLKATKELNMWGTLDKPRGDGYYRLYIPENERSVDFTVEYPSGDDDFYQRMIDSFRFGVIGDLVTE